MRMDAPTLSVRVAEEVRAWMGRRRMTGATLAAALGVSAAWVSYRLRGKQEIGLDDLQRIAMALDVSVADLLPTDIREAIRVTARYRDQAKQLDQDHPFGRPLVGDESSIRIDQDSRPRRLTLRVPPMPIMRATAA